MRVEAADYVFRTTDRRQKQEPTPAASERRRPGTERRRARHSSSPWLLATFSVHLIGQFSNERALPTIVRRAYQQPEAKSPRVPTQIRTA